MPDWYAPLRCMASLGSTAARPGGLSGLAESRQHTLSQFFTPEPVVRLLWSIVQPAMAQHRAERYARPVTLFDNSFGSGRLFQFADPTLHRLYGIEVHQPLADAVSTAVADAGFTAEIVAGSMEEHRAHGFDIGLINPPFNLAIDNPRAEPFPSGSYGAYGPASSHRSHRYALDQAREACAIVAAIMPASFANVATAEEHWRSGLHTVYLLPPGAFRTEGTEVDTCILVYGPDAPERPAVVPLTGLTVPPGNLPHLEIQQRHWKPPGITRAEVSDPGPVITLPVTRDRRVRVVRTGRKLILGFGCGLAEAEVMNDLLGDWLYERRSRDDRLPVGVHYRGQGVFDLQNLLAQDKPAQAYVQFLDRIRRLGYQPRPDTGILHWLWRAKRRLDRQRTPLRKVVADPTEPSGWTVRHPGLQVAYPALWQAMEARARRLGIDQWLTRPYQWHDLIELAVHGGGAIAGWDMGLGKARLAIALCLLGLGRRNLVVVEPRLMDEMRTELTGLPIDRDLWQIVDAPAHILDLKRVNVISYATLKKVLPGGSTRRTYARRLRRRIHTCICDEGHCLRNPDSDQTRAVHLISAKIRYALSGTPIANYPRDILPVVQWVAGDGTARQPFGRHHPYLDNGNLRDCSRARRGIDLFREMFVTTVWITNEFADGLRSGAKREIPKIARIGPFRDLVAPVLKRRVLEEPDVTACVTIPVPTIAVRTIPWDIPHLRFYHRVSADFVHWFRNLPEWQRRKGANLVAILAKIQGVITAGNHPQAGVRDLGVYAPLTSKQRFALDRLDSLTQDGHKTILFAHSPGVLDLFHAQLATQGIDAVRFHGGIPIAQRVVDLDRRFRQGDVPVLLASTGACQTGYNIHQADRVIVYDRDWTPKTEQQACARVLRPQQRREVAIEFLHLEGSIDTYQAQMVAHKASAMRAGLDEGEDGCDPTDFLHLDTILGRFVEDIEARLGLDLSREEVACA
jgi:hypothetical protein